MLACVVTIFAALWIPYRGLVVYNSFATMYSAPAYMDLWYLMFAKTCIYMNCAINPILYNAMSDKFRKAFRRFLFCGKLNEPPHNHLYCYNLNNKTTGLRVSPNHPMAHRRHRRENDNTFTPSWRINTKKSEDHSPSYPSNTTNVLLKNNAREPCENQETQF
ncbi:TRHR [Lepeophtheirus salmonis]|uniref:TRHR n=1 Tax=Lepeophtheirus salmonis TaxID=72036 RepID=A0A7R8CUD1_LEPSM|nr:TRHR [Lepeophtheirus salmonis]CAF2935568.1 TRHR [Lepeophtheirus salmonis]